MVSISDSPTQMYIVHTRIPFDFDVHTRVCDYAIMPLFDDECTGMMPFTLYILIKKKRKNIAQIPSIFTVPLQ